MWKNYIWISKVFMIEYRYEIFKLQMNQIYLSYSILPKHWSIFILSNVSTFLLSWFCIDNIPGKEILFQLPRLRLTRSLSIEMNWIAIHFRLSFSLSSQLDLIQERENTAADQNKLATTSTPPPSHKKGGLPNKYYCCPPKIGIIWNVTEEVES